MCLLCIEIAKGKMTAKEIASAYVEISTDDAHWGEVIEAMKEEGIWRDVQDALVDMFNDSFD